MNMSEEFDIEDVEGSVNANPFKIYRRPQGDWAIDVEFEVDITLPDERRLTHRVLLTIGHIRQFGRKKPPVNNLPRQKPKAESDSPNA